MRLFNNSDHYSEEPEASHSDNHYDQGDSRYGSSFSHSSQAPERSSRLVDEDSLLLQIDQFREKAEALQALINDRQSKVLHLEESVRAVEDRNHVLQHELEQKQNALNSVLGDIKDQFDILANRVDTSVNNVVTDVVTNVVTDKVNEAKEPVMEKIHSENVRLYRNIYDFIKEDYDTEKLEEKLKKSGGNKFMRHFGFWLTVANTGLLVFLLLKFFEVIG